MVSVSHLHLVPQVVQALQTVLCEAPQQLECCSGLLQRKRKVSGPLLAQTLILGWLRNPKAGMEELAQQAAEVGLSISATGLEKRMNGRTIAFLRELLNVAIGQVVMADPVAIGLLDRFQCVCLEDSTSVCLPSELTDLFQGCGGNSSPAACKLFARLDMLRGQLTCSPLLDGRCADAKSPLRDHLVPTRTLHIRDKGFTNVDRWAQEQQREEWVLTYLRGDLLIFDEQGHPLDLLPRLASASPQGEWRVLVGALRLPMRLFFERVPLEVATSRRRKLKAETAARRQTLSPKVSQLAAWNLAVTTVAEELLSWQEALVLLRLRWQIELLFKLWKQQGVWDGSSSSLPERIGCEVLAKLLGFLIQHWMLIVSCWHNPHRSLVKAAKAFRSQIALLSTALAGDWDLREAVERMLKVVGASAPLSRRADAPATSQLLLEGSNRWPSKPPQPWKPYRKVKKWLPRKKPIHS